MTRSRSVGGSGFRGFTNFTDWLAGQTGREDPVGAFARGAAADARWPRRRTTLPGFATYLYERDGGDFIREALDVAWKEYEAATDAAALRLSPRQG